MMIKIAYWEKKSRSLHFISIGNVLI